MKYPKNQPCHQCAPSEWRHTPNMTGDHEFDASVMHASAKRVSRDIAHHIKGGSIGNIIEDGRNAYQPRTNYAGGSYEGYHGDD
jgi:hypothetical protein